MIRCGVDIVEIPRFEEFLKNTDSDQLKTIFSEAEMDYCNAKKHRVQSLAARFAVKEACLKLFPKETTLKDLDFGDFSVDLDNYGAPHVAMSEKVSALLKRYETSEIAVSMTHTATLACGMAFAR